MKNNLKKLVSLVMVVAMLGASFVATSVGYADEKQFFKVFKSKVGCTPKQYREGKNASINLQNKLITF